MSIEYTIDIQLTELGYPDILQTSFRDAPYRPTSPDDSFSPSCAPTSLSTTQVQRLLVRGQQPVAGKDAGAAKPTPVVPAAPVTDSCTTRIPARGPRDVDAAPSLESPAAGPEDTDRPPLVTGQLDNGKEDADVAVTARAKSTEMQHAEDVSDDSEVSEMYEEEDEEDEDEEDEEVEGERLNDESSQSALYRCSVCDLQLSSKFKLQDHMNLHTGARPYSCAECGKRFCQINSYRVHLRTHAQNKGDLCRCRVCLLDFMSHKDLRVHLSRTHFEDQFYECDLCKRVFTSLRACEYHVRFPKCQLDVLCEMCGRSFSTPKSLARHRKSTCHRSFKCTDCTKSFPKKNALLKHSFSHLGLLPYTCVRCRCHYRLAKLYRKHKCEPERIHCVACLREFVSQEDFQRHKKDTGCWGNQESKGDEIRCLECGQQFDTPEELKKHAGAHQRVLKCAECGKGFRSALLLMSHMGGHAGISPCLCQSCGLGFPHQQNYDSHLKTCGKTSQPASAPKKRPASKSSSSETKRLGAKPDSSLPAAPAPAAVPPNPAAASKDPLGPGLVTGGVSAGSGQSDAGLWKLTLNEQPPPGVNLVVFLPVGTTQTDGLTPASGGSPALPATQGPPNEAPPPLSNDPLGATAAPSAALGAMAALEAMVNGPLNLVAGIKRDRKCEAPLDLSNKCNLSLSHLSTVSNVPLPHIKSELGEFEISGEAHGTERRDLKNLNGKVVVKMNLGEMDIITEGKRFKVDPMDLSSRTVNTTSPGLIVHLKKEPPSCQPTEVGIKM